MATLQDILTRSPISRQSRQDSPYRGARSRQANPGQSPDDPMKQMYVEQMGQVDHAEYNIQREREYEKFQEKLYQEFRVLDTNSDGKITMDELVNYLKSKMKDGQVDTTIAETIFDQFDRDDDGKINIAEFIEAYFEQYVEVQERVNELEKDIKQDKEKKQKIIEKLQEIKKTEQFNRDGIMIGSVLTIKIVEGRDFRSTGRITGVPNPFIQITVGRDSQNTTTVSNTNDPFFNEMLSFDIETGREEITVRAWDKGDIGGDAVIGECQIDLQILRDQYKHDDWFSLKDQRGQELQSRVRLNLHWIYSRTAFLEDIQKVQQDAIEDEEQERLLLLNQLENMKKPFGYVQSYYIQEEIKQAAKTENREERKARLDAIQLQVNEMEKQFEVKVDAVAKKVAEKLGYQQIPWFKWTFWITIIYSVITCFVCFKRQDFLNVTICSTAIYMLQNRHRITHNTFRWFVLLIVISVLYDLIWIAIKSSEFSSQGDDGGMELKLKQFSLNMSYANFFVKLIVAIVYWKDSLDFENIIMQNEDEKQIRKQSNDVFDDFDPRAQGERRRLEFP